MRILSALLLTLIVYACQTGPRKGEVTRMDASNIDNFCLLHDVATTPDGLLLKNQSSSITTQFNVRNFDLKLRRALKGFSSLQQRMPQAQQTDMR
jgi:hypothetical protein